MQPSTTITLSKPILVGSKSISRIVLREPSTLEALRFGEPFTIGQTADGSRFLVENQEAIERYLKVCITEPEDPMLILAAGGARLVKPLKEALFGFFLPESEESEASGEGSPTSPTTSFSTGETGSPSGTSIV